MNDTGNDDNFLVKVLQLALREAGVRLTASEVMEGLPPPPSPADGRDVMKEWALLALRRRDMVAAWRTVDLEAVGNSVLPAIIETRLGVAVLCSVGNGYMQLIEPRVGDAAVVLPIKNLRDDYLGQALFFKPLARSDARAADLVKVQPEHWFWHTVLRFRQYLYEAAALSVVINVLAISMALFSMTVYNRILPNQAYVTMWTLAVGVTLAVLFELGARIGRAWILDRASKKIDIVLGSQIFRHVLGSKLENRSQSSGAMANVVQSFESVRDFVTSATLTTLADLPFAVLFLAIIYMVAGPLAWVVAGVMLFVIAVALVVQWPLKRLMAEQMKLGSSKHGLVVESIESLETLKALRAESHTARRHDASSMSMAEISMRSRLISTVANSIISSSQQLGTIVTMVWGVYLVGEGAISMGAIIATTTLTSRALMPVSVLAGLAIRFQQTRVALSALETVMKAPQERDAQRAYVQLGGPIKNLECRALDFAYGKDLPPSVANLSLQIQAGERVAILGKMGSGKSTLLRLMVGLYAPTKGQVLVDSVDVGHVDPSNLRARAVLVTQEPRLMFGTLRDNLLLGAPHASDEELLRVAQVTGVAALAANHPKGYGMLIGERGETLSGGQKQAIALARALLAKPEVLLLDEPTSGMDMGSERMVLDALKPMLEGRTLVVVTHKPSLLQFVDRIVVLNDGQKVADGPRDEVLQALNRAAAPQPERKPVPRVVTMPTPKPTPAHAMA
jgi:ATP-binding cassette, subfamily C, bacterial LapB